MTNMERPFHRSFRGPGVSDEDDWRLIFDAGDGSVRVRRSWHGARHSGVEEFSLAEFLERRDAARDALIALLFAREAVEA